MKPRVFVSSTYYDLKHIRDRIERFIDNYKFEPVLFESDNVTFEHNKPLDISCYNEVKQCHIMILIIGGRYGSIATGENVNDKKETYNRDVLSITRREYETAIKMNIPTFIFIERNVYAEYLTFKKNVQFFEIHTPSDSGVFSFAHVDDVNVFKFISSIKGKAIKTFEKIDDIENYIANQLAGMLFLYLQQLQDTKKEEKLLDSVSELQRISEQMNEMIQAVGKNVFQENSFEFENVIQNQNRILIDFFANQFIDNISFNIEIHDFTIEETSKIYDIFLETILNYQLIDIIDKEKEWRDKIAKRQKIEDECSEKIRSINKNLSLKSYDFFKVSYNYHSKIYPIISNNTHLKDLLDNKLKAELQLKISGLPF